MKKLNRKGFTLIELLAVIVILAIIVVITVPTVLNSVGDAKLTSLWELSEQVASNYDKIVAEDSIATVKTLSEAEQVPSTWTCIGSLGKLAEILELSDTNIVLTGEAPTGDISSDTSTITASCSAIRIRNNGSAEVLLIAQPSGGKFSVSGKKVWALSTQDNGREQDLK